jgi:hypothetical protein
MVGVYSLSYGHRSVHQADRCDEIEELLITAAVGGKAVTQT